MKTENLDIRNQCCMELMREYPDNHFDLAVVDPPYGIGYSGKKRRNDGESKDKAGWKCGNRKEWDSAIPTAEYFEELERISKKRIIWGANYFWEYLGRTRALIEWDKMQEHSGSTFELAWSNFDKPAKSFRLSRVEAYQDGTIHPTQKPVKLYDWIFANYAEKGMRILDTHMGSGSIAIAAHYAGMHLTACELDKDYFKAACERIERETAQTTLF